MLLIDNHLKVKGTFLFIVETVTLKLFLVDVIDLCIFSLLNL